MTIFNCLSTWKLFLTDYSIVTRESSLSCDQYHGHGLQGKNRNNTWAKKEFIRRKQNDLMKILDDLTNSFKNPGLHIYKKVSLKGSNTLLAEKFCWQQRQEGKTGYFKNLNFFWVHLFWITWDLFFSYQVIFKIPQGDPGSKRFCLIFM